MSGFINFITGRKTAWVTLLLGIVFAGLAFGPLKATSTETNPGVGLPASSESVIVDEKLAKLPGSDSTAAVIVYASETEFTKEQLEWLQGTFDPFTQMLSGGANEKFTEYSNVLFNEEKFVPPTFCFQNKCRWVPIT